MSERVGMRGTHRLIIILAKPQLYQEYNRNKTHSEKPEGAYFSHKSCFLAGVLWLRSWDERDTFQIFVTLPYKQI